jgi:predicted enzyme related to lactoylglutathione lyase
MADKTVRGRFVWHELATPDASAAQKFYTKVLGWTTQTMEQDPTYTMFAASTGPLGGSVSSEDTARWTTYIGTADIDASVTKATSLGAKVVTATTTTSSGGKYAVLTDPQGATFGMYASAQPAGKEKPPKRGEYSWHELTTTDAPAALSFYSEVFGWDKIAEHDMGPSGVYYLFGRNGTQIGGIFAADVPGGPQWVGYVRVRDVHQTAKRVKSAGGTLTNGPMAVPGGDWVATFTDPLGVPFAVHTLAADLKPAAQPAGSAAAATPAAKSPVSSPAPESTPVQSTKASPTTKKPPKKKVAAPTALATAAAEERATKSSPAKSTKPAAKKAAKKKAAAKKKVVTKKTAKKKAAKKKVAKKKATQKVPAKKKKKVATKKKAAKRKLAPRASKRPAKTSRVAKKKADKKAKRKARKGK